MYYIPLEKQLHKKFAENWFAKEYFLVSILEVVKAMAEMELLNSGSHQPTDSHVALIWETIKALIGIFGLILIRFKVGLSKKAEMEVFIPAKQ